MHEPQVFDGTPFTSQVLPYVDQAGRDARLVIVKASFSIEPQRLPELLEEQREVRLGDEPWDDPDKSDNRFAADVCAAKPGTDVLIAGHAVSAHDRLSPCLDVAVRVADRSMSLRAHGPRVWQGVGPTLGPAEPTVNVPLRWGLAYGGIDLSDPSKPMECLENPVGLGVARDPVLLAGQPGPQIEHPSHPLRSPNRGVPIGVGPLGPNFLPRRQYAGTYDEAWLQRTYPAKPSDYASKFECLAPAPLSFEQPLQGKEACAIHGVRQDGQPLMFELPRERVRVEWVIDGQRTGADPHLDTVVIDTDAAVVELVWRVCIPTPAKMRNRFTEIHLWRKRDVTA